MEERLACTEEKWVRLPPSPLSRLRSVNGKHAPFVRPRCGFDSCRRLLPAPVAQRRERCSATAEAAGSTPAGRTTSADVAQWGEHRASNPERPVRAGSSALEGPWCKREHGELQPRRSGFESWRACLERSSRAGAARLSMGRAALGPCGSTPHIRPQLTTATCVSAAGRNGSGYRSRVRIPSGALRAPVAQWVERPVRAVSMTAAASSEMSDRGPERIGYLSPRSMGGREPPPGDAGSPPDLHPTTACPRLGCGPE